MNRSSSLRVILAIVAILPISGGAALAVEPGDFVRWVYNTTVTITHTTTSGSPCASNGIWSGTLTLSTPQFTQGFPGPPGAFPYFCIPHCGLGMTGQVTVTTPIDLSATDDAGTLTLSWNGGGAYQVFRSDNPAFAGPGTAVMPPDAGSAGTTFTDQTAPAVGKPLFYLVMNL